MVYEALQLTTPAIFRSQVAQFNVSGYQSPIDSEHGVRRGYVSIALTDECLAT